MEQDQLWSQNQTYEDSLKLLEETNAAVEMHNHGSCRLHFGHIDAMLVGTQFIKTVSFFFFHYILDNFPVCFDAKCLI